jgi:hypothetical protein
VKIIPDVQQTINLQSLGRTTFNTFKLVEMLQVQRLSLSTIMNRFDIAEATAYRLIKNTSDALWDYKIVNDGSNHFVIVPRSQE